MVLDSAAARLLVIAPHPDDEVIGCGGLIKRVKDGGGAVFVHVLTVGDTADACHGRVSTARQRQDEAAAVAGFLGVDDYEVSLIGNRFHLRLDQMPQVELIALIEKTSRVSIGKVKPTTVVLPEIRSYNQDHRAIATATMTALRPCVGRTRHMPGTVMTYEQLADHWTLDDPPQPNVFVGLTDEQLAAKLAALDLYESQHRESPDPRATDALASLARFRGAQSGLGLAEAFSCLRWCS